MADPDARKALNENTFREANEQLERNATVNVGVDSDSPVPFLCECPRIECTAVVLVTLAEYEDVRSDPRRGLCATGHEDPKIEDVVAQTDRFVVTEKFGRAGDVFAETDGRHDVSDERTRRIGHNEALYRAVNEEIEKVNQGQWAVAGTFSVVCECGMLECTQQIRIEPQVYERTRQNPSRFVVVPGHEIDDLEVVVERHEGFFVIEKVPADARRLAEETSPRD